MKKSNHSTVRLLTTLLGAAAMTALVQTNVRAAGAPVARWNFGEQDSGAVAGNTGNATTTDAINSPGNDLAQVGVPTYSATVPAGGSTLSMSFSGGQYYIGQQNGVVTNLIGMDVNNFSISYDCYPTGNADYSTPVSIGTYGGGSQFAFMNGANWCLNYNGAAGSGQPVIAPIQMNAWQNITWVRRFGTNVYFFNGVPMLTNTFFGAGTFAGTICIGGIIKNTTPAFDAPGGDFQGYVDNVVITNLNLGNPPVVSGFAVSPGIIYAGNSIIVNASVSGDPSGLSYSILTNGVVRTSGVTSLPYFINGVTTNNNGNYQLVAQNTFGGVTSSIVAVSVVASGGADVMKFRMGDNDPGAVAGNTGNAQTIDAIFGNNLDLAGNPTYSTNRLTGGGALSMAFDGGSYYRNTTLTNFLAGLDQNNFSLSADIYCSALGGGGFSFPFTLGRNGGGVGIVEIGGTWGMYRMGVGQNVFTSPFNLDAWNHVEIQRRNFDGTVLVRCFVNGQDQNFQGTTYSVASPILTVGGNTIGDGVGTEGFFTGMIDNVVIHDYSIGALPAIISGPTATPGTTVATNQALTVSVTMSGGTPATYIWKRNGTTVATQLTNNTSMVTFPAPVTAGTYSVVVSNSPSGVVTSSNLVITVDPRSDNPNVATYKLGENDPGAANRSAGNALTRQFDGVSDLPKVGSPTYTNFAAPDTSTLAMSFTGGTYYRNDNLGLFAKTGFNINNFSLSFDCYPTANMGYSTPVSIGLYGAGSFFFFMKGNGQWSHNYNGVDGSQPDLGPWTLNTWVHLEYRRVQGINSYWINGVQVGPTTETFAPGGASPLAALTIGGIGRASGGNFDAPGGDFVGFIDNVVIQNYPASLVFDLSGGQGLVNLTGGLVNTSYRLQRTLSLSPASWSDVDTQTTDANGAVQLTDPALPAIQAFYRAVTP